MMLIFLSIITINRDFQQGMWVRAACLAFPDSLSRIIEIATELNITDIYAQVVVGGYAYYDSDLLPRSQYLAKVASPDYDPLDSLIALVHKKSIKVHAWINALLVWSLKEKPDSINHLLYTHPDWFINDVRERSMATYSFEDWKDYGLEGLYLDPAQKEVREYIALICREIVKKYPVDGIHFDFIRYPGLYWGLGKTEKASIFYGSDVDTLRWLDLVRYPRLNLYLRWLVWHYWQINRDKERCLYQTMQLSSQAVQENAINNNCLFTAAVFANPGSARYSYAQNWWHWDEIIDYPVMMSYTQDIGLFSDFLNFAYTHQKNAIIGIGFLWPGIEDEAIWEIDAVKKSSGSGVCFFDYKNLDTLIDRARLKESTILRPESLLIDSSRYAKINNIFLDSVDIDFVKEGEKYVAWGEDLEFCAFLFSLSLNPERDLVRMGLTRGEFLNKIHDEVCGFEFIDNKIFPLGDELFEPPKREIAYEFLPWTQDSAVIKKRAAKTKKLTKHKVIYPWAMDKFARIVFAADKEKKEICSTGQGLYLFRVKKIYTGDKKAIIEKVKPELLPLYQSWTIKKRFGMLFEK